MPGIVQVKVVCARDLPIMDRSSELTDAFVEVKLGQAFHRTEVCPKTLNPVWNSLWFSFNVDDEDIQDEPVQLRLMDYDVYSAHDAIGKVYIGLNPLADRCGTAMLDGWFPIFDTLHGVRGEVRVKVKVDMIKDQHRFKQSSCGVRFFTCLEVPQGYFAETIHGFVEELVVNDDPEYQWMDKIRTPRSSNEARQRLFSKLSGELRRRVGVKALEVGGNAVIGYTQCFDLEGESGIVVRGIGTAVTLLPVVGPSPSSTPAPPLLSAPDRAAEEGRDSPSLSVLTSPHHRAATTTVPSSQSDSDSVPASPTKPFAPGDLGGLFHQTPVALSTSSALKPPFAISSEFPFFTLTSLPPGNLMRIGGVVSARSVKMLDKINNPDDPETRDAWWGEVRNEVKSHMGAMACNLVIGYSESTTICDSLCIFSATGTAVDIQRTSYFPRPPTSPGSVGDVKQSSDDAREDAESPPMDSPPLCRVFHIPYSLVKPPFEIRPLKCAMCRGSFVPSVLLSTCEVPVLRAVRGRGCLVQARVCYPKRKGKGDENAFQVSKQLPFLEYKLHSRLLSKLQVKGMNAIFGLKVQVSVGDTMLIGIATGTAVYLEALPPPSQMVVGGTETARYIEHLREVQAALNKEQEDNRTRFNLELPLDLGYGGVAVEAELSGGEDEGGELDLALGKREAFVVDVEDKIVKEEDLLEIIIDRALPQGFHTSTMCSVPGLQPQLLSQESRMVTMVTKKTISDPQHLEKQFTQYCDQILRALAFKVRQMHPCALSHVRFDVDLPDDDEVQVSVTAMATKLTETLEGTHHRKKSDDLLFLMDDSSITYSPQAGGGLKLKPEMRSQPVLMTPLPSFPECQVERHLGMINLFLIRESTSVQGTEVRGLNKFMNQFLLEVNSIARAHVAALGGNALLSYKLSECALIEHPHKNQAQCLLNLSGDAAVVKFEGSLSLTQAEEITDTLNPLSAMQLIPIPDSPLPPSRPLATPARMYTAGAKETMHRVTKL